MSDYDTTAFMSMASADIRPKGLQLRGKAELASPLTFVVVLFTRVSPYPHDVEECDGEYSL